MARKTAGAGGESWDKQGELHGIYTDKKTNVGVHGSNVYVVEKQDGEKLQVWGSTVLDGRFQEIPVGSEVWITCLGEAVSKKGTKYVDYNVEYDDDAASLINDGGTPAPAEAADNPFRNN